MTLKFKRVSNGAELELPHYQTAGAAGMDVRAATNLILEVGQTKLVPTGFALEIPHGYEVQLRPRSGLALKHSLTMLNSPATIDSDYRGEVGVILTNLGQQSFEIKRGDRIAQMVVARVEHAEIIEVDELGESDRGTGGFGHTGV